MKLRLSEEERMLQRLFSDFFQREYTPVVARRTERELGGRGEWSPEVWESLTELGVLQLTLPEAAGGIEAGQTGAVLLAEQMGRAAYQSPYFDTVAAAELLLAAGSRCAVQTLLEPIAHGACGMAMMDRHTARLKMERTDGGWLVDGESRFVPFAKQADYLAAIQGTQLLLIPRLSDGLTLRRQDEIGRGELYAVQAKQVFVPSESVIELQPDAIESAMANARIRQAAYLAGLSQGALELTIRYVKERKQFGQQLASFQALSFRLSAFAAQIEAVRLYVCHGAGMSDSGDDVRSRSSQMIALAGDLALDVTRAALQMHGSFGLCEEAEPQRYYRRAVADRLLWGQTAWHLEEAAALLLADEGE